nr:immunoglobulin light chain junction region [Macaca mulatta]MOX20338.1 immunoglobulin light chain junction region [Macaca mulatta]MOX20747.1 immunoglobulin light chain junction region [Macaca mulatta]MOX22143.1 immunoglobulin light chain junction region [Macaca mulatta]
DYYCQTWTSDIGLF